MLESDSVFRMTETPTYDDTIVDMPNKKLSNQQWIAGMSRLTVVDPAARAHIEVIDR